MGEHLIDNEFQSDKYPTCPRGKVPLSTKDPTAQGLLWMYAQRRRSVDASFSEDLEQALRNHGYDPGALDTKPLPRLLRELLQSNLHPETREADRDRVVDLACDLIRHERDGAVVDLGHALGQSLLRAALKRAEERQRLAADVPTEADETDGVVDAFTVTTEVWIEGVPNRAMLALRRAIGGKMVRDEEKS